MKDFVIKLSIALMNFFSVVIIICCGNVPADTPDKRFLRAVMIIMYFTTFVLMCVGDKEDENNNIEDDDVSDV